MKDSNFEKLLYKMAALLVVCGAVVRFLDLSDNYLGLHLILAGLIIGAAAIFVQMWHQNQSERRKHTNLKERQFKKH
jgi:nitrate/nitrite transporter NarK